MGAQGAVRNGETRLCSVTRDERMITIFECLEFKEGIRANRIDKLPSFLRELFENEYSPLRAYLDHVQPGCLVKLNISVEIVQPTTDA